MIQPVYIVDIFRDIVAATSAVLLTDLQAVDPLISGVHYDYGHYNDVRERLVAKDQSAKTEKYPLVVLFEDYKISHGQVGLTGIASLKLIILYISKKDITRQQRETNVFRPILYPIYNEFLRQIKLSGKFMVASVDQIKHDQINRPHWGDPELYGNKGYLFNDVLDGIEITNLELKTYLPNCL